MDSARIAALLEPFLEGCPTSRTFRDAESALSPTQLDQISTYIDLLLRWNARINLTAIRNPEEIVTRHFGESLFLARHLFPNPCHLEPGSCFAPRVIDLGSGAGFPALPLNIWAPHVHLQLIESNHKKAAFLREVARALTLTDIDVIADRAETVSTRQTPDTQADIVTFRAVEKFDRILPLAVTFLAPSARLALLISAAQLPKLESQPDLTWQTEHIPKSQQMILAIGRFNKRRNEI